MVLGQASNTIPNRCGENGHPCRFTVLRRKLQFYTIEGDGSCRFVLSVLHQIEEVYFFACFAKNYYE
jgi:hypothetical protein